MTQTDQRPSDDRQATPLPIDLTARELARWSWRQVTSMRTALVLLLLLALAAVPGSVIPQEDIDSLAVSQWREDHPRLAPIWDRLDLFSVYGSVWFSAIYILLMISLVGCIVPRLFVYARALEGPRMPLAVLRRQAKELPLAFTLDDSMAMAPGMDLSSAGEFMVVARISRSGDVAPQSGDLEGSAGPVRPGATDVRIEIDRVVP